MRRSTYALALGLLAALVAGPLRAQERVTFEGRGPLETDTILTRIVESGAYRLITADTIYSPADTLHGPILFAATTVKLENVIIGDVAIVDANVFLRPSSRITGDVISINGGLFRANTAVIEGNIREYRDAPYRSERTRDGARIVGTQLASLLDLDGFGGFHAPQYDRVQGLAVTFGGRYLLPRIGNTEPDIGGRIGYQTAREKLHGGVEIGLRNGPFRFRGGLEQRVITRDDWLRGWSNAVSYLVRGDDYRDYYEADHLYLGPTFIFGPESRRLILRLDGEIEDARSLPAREPWNVLGDSVRPNPAIDDGRITGLRLDVEGQLERPTLVGRADLRIETATTVLGGDFKFARIDIGGTWAMQAIANHTFRIRARLRAPLPGTDSLPRQRWSVLGGRSSLYTTQIGDLRGDRLVYIESTYLLPLPAVLSMPILRRPHIELGHRIGRAWTAGQDPDFIQNVSAGLRFRVAYFTVAFDPARTGEDPVIVAGVSFQRRYPWSVFD